jgi:hypothetical protein
MNTIRPDDPRYRPSDTSLAENRKLWNAIEAAHKEWVEETKEKMKMHEISEAFKLASEHGSIKIYL